MSFLRHGEPGCDGAHAGARGDADDFEAGLRQERLPLAAGALLAAYLKHATRTTPRSAFIEALPGCVGSTTSKPQGSTFPSGVVAELFLSHRDEHVEVEVVAEVERPRLVAQAVAPHQVEHHEQRRWAGWRRRRGSHGGSHHAQQSGRVGVRPVVQNVLFFEVGTREQECTRKRERKMCVQV